MGAAGRCGGLLRPALHGHPPRLGPAGGAADRRRETVMDLPLEADIDRQVTGLGAALLARGWRMATAGRCTGGWIGKAVPERAGSPVALEAGLVASRHAARPR